MSLLKTILTKFASVFSLLMIAFAILVPAPAYAADLIPGSSTLCNGACPLVSNPDTVKGNQNSLAEFILGIARFVTYIVGAISVLFLVYGGFSFVTDNGDGKSAEKGKKILLNAVIGLVVAIVAYTVVGLVGNLVQGNVADQFVNQ